jgi:outer membrane protein assembly factor BamB
MVRRILLAGACLSLVVGPATRAGATGMVARTFTRSGISFSAGLGSAVATVGGRIVVGAPGESTGPCGQNGAVLVFDAATGAPLVDIFPHAIDGCASRLGSAVADLDGDILATAPQQLTGPGGLRHGVVRRFDAATGALEQTFVHPAPSALFASSFGAAIAAAEGDVLVGAPFGVELEDSASGIVFRFDGVTGAPVGSFTRPEPAANDAFGSALAVASGRLFVGAPGGDAFGGEVHAFDLATGQHLWTAANPEVLDLGGFATSLAADAAVVAVGDSFDPGNERVHLFDAATGAYLRTLVTPEPNAALPIRTGFGRSLAAFGGGFLIGAPFTLVGGSTSRGAAYLFDGASGLLRYRFHAPFTNCCADFGTAVAAAGGRVLVGAPRLNISPPGGTAFLFETCFSLGEGAACDDGNGCDTGDVCVSGACLPGPPIGCGTPPQCRLPGCEPATGICNGRAVPDETLCYLGGPTDCSVGDRCLGGSCFQNFALPPPSQRDVDFDAVCNTDDNCASVANPGQENADGDPAGNACDASDGLLVLHNAKLRFDRPGRAGTGRITVRGEFLSRADETPFNPDAGISVRIADELGLEHDFSWPAEQCTGSGRLRCQRRGRPTARIDFRPLEQRSDGLIVYNFALKLDGVGVTAPVAAPIAVTITSQPLFPVVGFDRTGAVAGCRESPRSVSCRVAAVDVGSASEAFLEVPESLVQ